MKVFQNVFWSFLGKIIAMLFLVLLDILAARMLSIEDYAEWVFFFAILTMLFYIGWMGINTSAKVYVSKSTNTQERDNCIRAAWFLRCVVSAVIGILLFMILPKTAEYLGYPDKYPALKSLLAMAAVLVFLNSFTEWYKELWIGLEAYKNLFVIISCEYGGYFLFSAIGLLLSHRMQAIAFGYFISGICIFLIGQYMLYKKIGFRFGNTDITHKAYRKPILRYAFPIAVISFGSLILIEMDTFMLGLLSVKEEVAIYNIAKNLCAKATHVNYSLTIGTMTSFSALSAVNISKKKREFKKINRINLAITMIIAAVMCLFSTMAISLLYGTEYKMAGMAMRFLVPYYALYSISNFYAAFLDFREKARIRSICFISVIIINLTLNYLLIPVYGAKGAALATDISLIPYTIAVVVCTFAEFRKIEAGKKLDRS